jgi:hypothetical protein
MELSSGAVIFPAGSPALGKRVFQVAYTKTFSIQRANRLRNLGYGVLSVMGNVAAKTLLTVVPMKPRELALFIVGHTGSEEARSEVVRWLKSRYPLVPLVALNPPQQEVVGADYNVLNDNTDLWLRLMA